ncbi:DEAD/DEAH box helicase family protein [Pseudomonas aeruginosa]
MALSLKIYQKRALSSLESYLDDARLKGPAQAFEGNVDKGLLGQYKPMPGQPDIPYVCLRIPTGGGKTVMGAHIIKAAGQTILEREYPLVLWMVPTTQIKSQTLDAFRNPRHPYRQELAETFGGRWPSLTWPTSPRFAPPTWVPRCVWSSARWRRCA